MRGPPTPSSPPHVRGPRQHASASPPRSPHETPLAPPAQRALADWFVARRRRELFDARTRELEAEASRTAHHGVIDAARLTLARSRADREVIERHFARWREQRKKLAERRED